MYLSYNQILEIINSTKTSHTLLDSLTPLVSTLIGGILSIIATYLLLNRQNKNKQKEIKNMESIKKKNKQISDLKDYYIQFNNYFLGIYCSYYTFNRVIYGGLLYNDWYNQKNQELPYDYAQIKLLTSLYNFDNQIKEFYAVLDKMNSLYKPYDLKKFKNGEKRFVDKSQYDELIHKLKTEGLNYQNVIMKSIIEIDSKEI